MFNAQNLLHLFTTYIKKFCLKFHDIEHVGSVAAIDSTDYVKLAVNLKKVIIPI